MPSELAAVPENLPHPNEQRPVNQAQTCQGHTNAAQIGVFLTMAQAINISGALAKHQKDNEALKTRNEAMKEAVEAAKVSLCTALAALNAVEEVIRQ